MGTDEVFIKIPIGLYKNLMLELKDKAEKEMEHGKYDLKKIEEMRKTIKKYNKDVFGGEKDGN